MATLLAVGVGQAQALSWTRHIPRVSDEVFTELLDLARRQGGLKALGKRMEREHLPLNVAEGTLLHLAVEKNVLSTGEAREMFKRLSGVPGFRTTLKKTLSVNPGTSRGHRYELRLASDAARSGFKVEHINLRYRDGRKQAPTDIDLVLESEATKRGWVVECKSYDAPDSIPVDRLRSDMDTLRSYVERAKPKRVIPVLSLEARPDREVVWSRIREAARHRGIELIVGPAPAAATLLARLDQAR